MTREQAKPFGTQGKTGWFDGTEWEELCTFERCTARVNPGCLVQTLAWKHHMSTISTAGRRLFWHSNQYLFFPKRNQKKKLSPLTFILWYKNILSDVYLSPYTISSHLERKKKKIYLQITKYTNWTKYIQYMMKCVHWKRRVCLDSRRKILSSARSIKLRFNMLDSSSFNRKTKHSKALQIRLQLFTLQLATVQ